MEVNANASIIPSQQTVDSAAGLAENFDDFLTLLTAQLQHQDPLEPMDANEFTSQLVQFSSVEQAIAQNARLDSLISLQQTNQVANAASFIGKSIEATTSTVELKDGTASVKYSLQSSAAGVIVTVSNEQGQIIRSQEGVSSVGPHEFVWDGLDNQGLEQPEGIYTINVTAVDDNGASFPLNTTVSGLVDGVSAENGQIVLSMGGVTVPLESVLSVKTPDASDPS